MTCSARSIARTAVLAAVLVAGCDRGAAVDRRTEGVPGAPFVDHHVHLFNVGWWLLQHERADQSYIAAGGARSEGEVAQRVAAARPDSSGWITGFGWNQEAWSPSRLPGIESLSAARPGSPVALARTDGHALWVNAAALRAAGLPSSTPGVLLERDGEAVIARIPLPADSDIVAAWRLGAEALAERGVSRVYDAGVLALPGIAVLNTDFERYVRLLATADRAQSLPLAVNLMIPAPSAFAESVLAMSESERRLSPNVRITHLKLFADGALGSRGAALSQPYADDPHTTGVLRMDATEIATWTRRALDAGLDVATHAIGDAAVSAALDAYELVLRERPGTVPTRLRVEHFSYAAESDFERAVRLGIALSVQSNFNSPRGGAEPSFAEKRVGATNAPRVYAWDRLEGMGAVLVEGSDYFGEPGRPLAGIHAALTGVNAIGDRGDSPEVRALVLRLHRRWLAPGGTFDDPDAVRRRIRLSADPLALPVDSLPGVSVLRVP